MRGISPFGLLLSMKLLPPDSFVDEQTNPVFCIREACKPIEGLSDMEPTIKKNSVCLRNVGPDDLPRIYEFQLDPESNHLAVTIPRSAEAFDAHWDIALRDPNITAKAIIVGDVLAGCISCFNMDGLDAVGYWLGREFWGRGIASQALNLLLTEVSTRPLYARVATSNGASLRVLHKCGFVVERVQVSPADDRYPECEEAVLVLREPTIGKKSMPDLQ